MSTLYLFSFNNKEMHLGCARCPFCLQQRGCGEVRPWEWDLSGLCVWERRAVTTSQPHGFFVLLRKTFEIFPTSLQPLWDAAAEGPSCSPSRIPGRNELKCLKRAGVVHMWFFWRKENQGKLQDHRGFENFLPLLSRWREDLLCWCVVQE